MRRVATISMVLLGMLVLAGCPGKDEPAENPAGEPAADPVEPEVVSPLEMLPNEDDDAAGASADWQASTRNAVHPIAGRSAFPEADESVTQLIPAKKLSEEDQFASPIDASDIPDIVPWEEAHKYVGHEITVEGKIVDIGQSRDGKVNFLNFHKEWRGKFYMVLFDDLAKTLPESVAATFKGKTLRVKGEVEDHRGRPQIKILSMDQVEFVGE